MALTKLTDLEIREILMSGRDWVYKEGKLQKTYKFANFARSVLFLNKILNPVEEWQSFPRIEIAYNQVLIELFNNFAGGITEREVKLMKLFDKLS